MLKKFFSVFLMLSIVLSTFSVLSSFQAASETTGGRIVDSGLVKDSQVLAYYPLRSDVKDASGNGYDGTLKGNGAVFDGLSMHLPGGSSSSSAAYAQLPTGMLNGHDSLTISVWAKDEAGKKNQSTLFFGNNKTPPTRYWILNDSNPGGYFKSVITCGEENIGSPWSTETGVPNSTVTDCTNWNLYTTVFTPTTITGYLNGQKLGQASISTSVNGLGNNLDFMIGRSFYTDDFFKGSLRDLIVYKDALTEEDVVEIYEQGKLDGDKIVRYDEDSCEIKDSGNVTADLQLPKKGTYGSDIFWFCTDPGIVIEDGGTSCFTGKVTRPASTDGDRQVTLKATFSYGGTNDTKDYMVTLKALPSNCRPISMR